MLIVWIYPELLKNVIFVTYCWYRNKSDYDEIISTSIDQDCKSYEKWLTDSEIRLSAFDGEIEYIKIAMQPKQLNAWLDRKQLSNNETNRKNYAIEVYTSAKKNGVENKI